MNCSTINQSKLRVGAALWRLRKIDSLEGFFRHLQDLVDRAREQKVEILVLPETFSIELLALRAGLPERSWATWLAELGDETVAFMATLAQRHHMTIVGGSLLFREEGRLVNSAPVLYPDGENERCDKRIPTPYERETWGVSPGALSRPLRDPRIAVTICYDIEFPELTVQRCQAGALLHCVPSFTESRFGYQRVRWCAQARTIENQVYVAVAAITGSLPRLALSAYGTASIFCPSVPPFPESAILAETEGDDEGIAVATVDLNLLAEIRESGEVRNWEDRSLLKIE